MKSTFAILALSVAAAGAFQVAPSPRASFALGMGVFDGRGQKVTVREDEDAAMWFDDKQGGRTPAEPKKPDPKEAEAKDTKKGGFKFPWDK